MLLSHIKSPTKSTLFPSRLLIHHFTQRAVNQVITTSQLLFFMPTNLKTYQSSAVLVTSSAFIVHSSAFTMADVNSTPTSLKNTPGHHGLFLVLKTTPAPQLHTQETVLLSKSMTAHSLLLLENGLDHTSPRMMLLPQTCTHLFPELRKPPKILMLLLRS